MRGFNLAIQAEINFFLHCMVFRLGRGSICGLLVVVPARQDY